MSYNKEEVMKAFDERYSDSEVDGHLMKSALRENHRQFLSTALDAAYAAGKAERKVEHCAEPECPECNIAAYKAGREEGLKEGQKVLEHFYKHEALK